MSMIERVARAVCRHRYEKEHMVGLTVSAIQRDLYVDKRWHEYEGMARAAIEAMMSPTPSMIEAGQQCEGYGGDGGQIYRAMLSAALHGDQEG